jgi:hypothetical protein
VSLYPFISLPILSLSVQESISTSRLAVCLNSGQEMQTHSIFLLVLFTIFILLFELCSLCLISHRIFYACFYFPPFSYFSRHFLLLFFPAFFSVPGWRTARRSGAAGAAPAAGHAACVHVALLIPTRASYVSCLSVGCCPGIFNINVFLSDFLFACVTLELRFEA